MLLLYASCKLDIQKKSRKAALACLWIERDRWCRIQVSNWWVARTAGCCLTFTCSALHITRDIVVTWQRLFLLSCVPWATRHVVADDMLVSHSLQTYTPCMPPCMTLVAHKKLPKSLRCYFAHSKWSEFILSVKAILLANFTDVISNLTNLLRLMQADLES